MSTGRRGPARSRSKVNTNASAGDAAAFRKKRDATEVGKAQPTLTSFFTTPKTKPGDVAPLSDPCATKNRGSRGRTAREDDSSKPEKDQNRLEPIDVTDSNGAPPTSASDESPSSAAKAVRFKFDSHEAGDGDQSGATTPGKGKRMEKSKRNQKAKSFPGPGKKRSRKGADAKSEVKAESSRAKAKHENNGKKDEEDVVMSQPKVIPASVAGANGTHSAQTPPFKFQRGHSNVCRESAAKEPSVAASNDRGAGASEQAGQEGFVTPARTPPPSTEISRETSCALPSGSHGVASEANGTKHEEGVAPPPPETQEFPAQETVIDIRPTNGRSPNAGGMRAGKTMGSKKKARAGAAAAARSPSSSPAPPSQQPSAPHPKLAKYRDQLTAAVASAALADGVDRRLGLQEAADGAVAWKAVGAAACSENDGIERGDDGGEATVFSAIVDTSFPEHLSPLLARVVQGSSSPLSELAEEALGVMKSLVPQLAAELTTSQVAAKISLVAQRKCYGAQPKNAVIAEDTRSEGVWRWEVQLMDLLPVDKAGVVRQSRNERVNIGKLVRALVRLTEVMTKFPADAAKISKEEEKVLTFARKEEVLRQKASLRGVEVAMKEQAKREKEEARDEERKAKEEERRKKVEQKQQEKVAKAEEKRRLKEQQAAAAAEERRKQEEANTTQGTVSLLKFFKAAEPSAQDSKENTAPFAIDSSLSSSAGKIAGCVRSDVGHGGLPLPEASACREGALATVSDRDGGVNVGGEGTDGRMSIGGFGAAEVEEFERRLRQGGEPEELLANTAKKDRVERLRKRKTWAAPSNGESEVEIVRPKRIKVSVTVSAGGGGFGEQAYSEEKEVEVRNRMKLLQFHHDHRPPYWGTWSKSSREVTGRRPLGRDSKGLLNYDYDSEADWEEEAQGEDLLSDEEGDKEPEDNLDYKDGWLRQDDEFSDEEIDRFDNDNDEDGNHVNANASTISVIKKPNGPAVIGVGEGVRLGAGAAAAATTTTAGNGNGGQPWQQAFVSSLMFRVEPITGEEARAKPALLALSAYRAVAFPFGGATSTPGGGGVATGGGFPVPVIDALVDKPRREDTGDDEGEDGGDEKGKQKIKKYKDVPDDILPFLVEMLHGKTTKREDIVNSFVALHPLCTKKSVHQKVKDMATRERSIRGGTVFVVREEVMERLGVEPTTSVELKPTAAEIAATAEQASSAGRGEEGGGEGSGSIDTPPRSGKKTKGNDDKGKLVPPPGQLSLLGFLQTAKEGSAGESSPPSRATPKVLFGPSGEAAIAAAIAAEAAVAAAEAANNAPTDPKDDSAAGETEQGSGKADAEEVARTKKSDSTRKEDEVTESDGDDEVKAPTRRSPGPDANGGWEECKESEPPMGKAVPVCNVLTPSKKVRQVAATRPVLYLGSGPPPPPRRVILDDDR